MRFRLKYEWLTGKNGDWLYEDPNGIIAAQIEYDDHTGKKAWVAYDLTKEGPTTKIGIYSELGQAKHAVEIYFQPPARSARA